MPKFPYAHFSKGYAHYNLRQYAEAINELTQALDQGYEADEVYAVRWQAYFLIKDWSSALSDIRNAQKKDSKNPYFHIAEGQINHELARYSDAINAYQRGLNLGSKNNNVHYFMARAYNAAGNFEQQGLAAKKALDGGTRFPAEAWFFVGDSLQRQRKYKEAAKAYELSFAAKQDIREVYINLSDTYRNLNEFHKAIKIALAGTRKYPNDGDLKVSLSWYYSLGDQHGNAIAVANEAIKIVPNQYMAHTNLCRAYNDLKEYNSAIGSCKRALELQPGDGETNFYLGRAYQLLGNPDVAAGYYKDAVTGLIEFTRNNPDYSDGFYLLGNAYFADGQRDNAISAYQKCLEISPMFAKARYNLGYVYTQAGNATAARKQYAALQDIDADLAGKLLEVIDNR